MEDFFELSPSTMRYNEITTGGAYPMVEIFGVCEDYDSLVIGLRVAQFVL